MKVKTKSNPSGCAGWMLHDVAVLINLPRSSSRGVYENTDIMLHGPEQRRLRFRATAAFPAFREINRRTRGFSPSSTEPKAIAFAFGLAFGSGAAKRNPYSLEKVGVEGEGRTNECVRMGVALCFQPSSNHR